MAAPNVLRGKLLSPSPDRSGILCGAKRSKDTAESGKSFKNSTHSYAS